MPGSLLSSAPVKTLGGPCNIFTRSCVFVLFLEKKEMLTAVGKDICSIALIALGLSGQNCHYFWARPFREPLNWCLSSALMSLLNYPHEKQDLFEIESNWCLTCERFWKTCTGINQLMCFSHSSPYWTFWSQLLFSTPLSKCNPYPGLWGSVGWRILPCTKGLQYWFPVRHLPWL